MSWDVSPENRKARKVKRRGAGAPGCLVMGSNMTCLDSAPALKKVGGGGGGGGLRDICFSFPKKVETK